MFWPWISIGWYILTSRLDKKYLTHTKEFIFGVNFSQKWVVEILWINQVLTGWKKTNFSSKFVKNHKKSLKHANLVYQIKIVVKNSNLKNRNFPQKFKFWSEIEVLVKYRNFPQKLKCWSKIRILLKNWNFGQKLKCSSKIEMCSKIKMFAKKLKIRFHRVESSPNILVS